MMELDIEQQYVIDLIRKGYNIFLTGEAGTGKSFIIKYLKENSIREIIYLGPTGVSARNIGGCTIHSLFGFPSTALTPEQLCIMSDKQLAILRLVEIIVVDEISMVRSDLFQAMDIMLKKANNTDKSFGGKQLICVGDYYQLPPVPGSENVQRYLNERLGGIYAFNTKSWKDANLKPVILTKVHRQQDRDFLDMLKSVRTCQPDLNKYLDLCNKRVVSEPITDNLKALHATDHICMCCTRRNASYINNSALAMLPDRGFTNNAKVIGRFPHEEWPTDYSLRIKEGEKVMLLNNRKVGNYYEYANGDIGIVYEYYPDCRQIKVRLSKMDVATIVPDTWEYYEYDIEQNAEGKLHIVPKEVGQFIQYPLVAGYACTIHKSQGKTLDQAHLVLGSGCFAYGQLYTALSRLRSLNGLTIQRPIMFHEAFVDPQINAFYDSLKNEL